MDNLELMVVCALRNIFFQSECHSEKITFKVTKRIKDILDSDIKNGLFDVTDKSIKQVMSTLGTTDEIKLTDSQLNHIYLRAIMYSLGRRTYITGVAKEWTEEYLPLINKETKKEVVKLIENHHNLGDQCDIDNWQIVKELLKD